MGKVDSAADRTPPGSTPSDYRALLRLERRLASKSIERYLRGNNPYLARQVERSGTLSVGYGVCASLWGAIAFLLWVLVIISLVLIRVPVVEIVFGVLLAVIMVLASVRLLQARSASSSRMRS